MYTMVQHSRKQHYKRHTLPSPPAPSWLPGTTRMYRCLNPARNLIFARFIVTKRRQISDMAFSILHLVISVHERGYIINIVFTVQASRYFLKNIGETYR